MSQSTPTIFWSSGKWSEEVDNGGGFTLLEAMPCDVEAHLLNLQRQGVNEKLDRITENLQKRQVLNIISTYAVTQEDRDLYRRWEKEHADEMRLKDAVGALHDGLSYGNWPWLTTMLYRGGKK